MNKRSSVVKLAKLNRIAGEKTKTNIFPTAESDATRTTTTDGALRSGSQHLFLSVSIGISGGDFGKMLIKPEGLTPPDGPSADGEEDKLQERLKLDQQDNAAKLRRFSVKYSSERKKSASPLDITEVRPCLLLSGAFALRGNTLEDLNVTCVINATTELPDTPLPSSLKDRILYLRVNVLDKSDADILSWLDFVTDTIHQVKLAGGRTLIHCVAGVSRSATLVLAYLIKYEGCSLHDSYLLLKALRNTIRPNSGFFGQLVEFEKRTTGKQTVMMIHSDYAHAYIPQMYEEEYHKLHMLKCHRR